jgi:hypothetical protein
MLLQGVAVNKYVVQVYIYKTSNVISKDHCHQMLKCYGGIAIPLLHHLAYIGAIYYGEGCCPNILWFYPNLFIGV